MKANEIDWQAGRVIYWDLDEIPRSGNLAANLSLLKEDLALVSFPGGILLDIGWYPEFSKDGHFLVSLLHGIEWDEPISREECRTLDEMKAAAERAAVRAGSFSQGSSSE